MTITNSISLQGRVLERALRAGMLASVSLGILLCVGGVAVAQEGGDPEKSAVSVSGSIQLTGDVYGFSATPNGAENPRRPANLWRLLFNPVIHIGDLISLPLSFMLSSRETNTTTQSVVSPSLIQFLQNPMNNIGMLSFMPRVGWAQAALGSHVPSYSELSTGDEQIFGLGLELKPGSFRFSVNGGTSQRAIEADTANGVRGAYARRMYSAKLGYGDEDGSLVDFNVVRAKDDVSSIRTRPVGIEPQEGLVLTSNFRIGLSERSALTGEVGGSAFTRDLDADIASVSSPVPQSVYRHRVSTATDYAGNMMFHYAEKEWGLKAGGKYIGAGYFSLAFPYMQPDRLDLLLAPFAKLFANKLNMNASIGYRKNNLSNTKATTSNQLIGSFNAFAMLSDYVSFNTRFANYGIRNRMAVDTLKVDMVTNSFSLSPTFVIPSSALINTVSLSWSLDAYNEVNTMTAKTTTNNTQSMMAMYLASFTEIPMNGSVTLTYMTNNVPNNDLKLFSGSVGASYRFLDGAVQPSLAVTVSNNSLAQFTADKQLLFRIGVQWNISSAVSLSLFGTSNNYTYGSSRPGVTFRETFLETSIATVF